MILRRACFYLLTDVLHLKKFFFFLIQVVHRISFHFMGGRSNQKLGYFNAVHLH